MDKKWTEKLKTSKQNRNIILNKFEKSQHWFLFWTIAEKGQISFN
jgi:hypothetical protein